QRTDQYWRALVDLGGSPVRLELRSGERLMVNRALRGVGVQQKLLLYWYDAGGRVYKDRVPAKFVTLWQRVTGAGRPPSVVIASTSTGGVAETVTAGALAKFASELVIALRQSAAQAGLPRLPAR
ncbi:MAG: exosortase-associated EpsI family protein, partial [Acidimicrobiia bacterium]